MAGSDPSDQYSPEPNLLERKAAEYLQQQKGAPDRLERRLVSADELWRAQLRAIIWGAGAGIVSGAIIGGSELFVREGLLSGEDIAGWGRQLPYWAGFFALAGLISAAEILALYRIALRGIARISRIAGIGLVGTGYANLVALGQARAALEFPNPRVLIYGIDPYARVSGWKLALQSLLYRLKVGVSTFALRIVLRRVFGRMVVRGIIPLLAGPLYAAWNAIIVWRIMQEARIRAFGPFAVEDLMHQLATSEERLRPEIGELVLQGTGELVMRGSDAHPNYVVLLSRLIDKLNIDGGAIEVDWPKQRKRLQDLDGDGQNAVLNALTVASLLGSSVRRPQKEFVQEVHADCGRAVQPGAFKRLRKRLIDGQPITTKDLESLRR